MVTPTYPFYSSLLPTIEPAPEPILETPTGGFVPEEAVEAQITEGAQQSNIVTFAENLAPAVSSAMRLIRDEGLIGLVSTPVDPNYDPAQHMAELTKDIPVSMQDGIASAGSYGEALRTRDRILADIDRGKRLMRQQGVSPMMAMLAGSVVDADLPLMFMTGGGYKAAQVSRRAMRLSYRAGLSPNAATRVSSAAVGASAGLQAGALTGAVEAHTRDTADWTLVAEAALTSMALGGGLNPIVRGDLQIAVKNARDELYDQIARDAPELSSKVKINPDSAQPITPEPIVPEGEGSNVIRPKVFNPDDIDEGPATVGAAQQGGRIPGQPASPGATYSRGLTDPAGPISARNAEILDNADAWRNDSGWLDDKLDVAEEWWTRVATSAGANLSTGNFNDLYRSKSAVLNWLAGTAFESPNGLGRGRFTASAGMEFYHRNIFSPISADVEPAMQAWAKANDRGMLGTNIHISEEGRRIFNREVMLELNARTRQMSYTNDPHIQRAANAYDEAGKRAITAGRGAPGQRSVDGLENVPDKSGYTPYRWNGNAIIRLVQEGVTTELDMVRAMTRAYARAGIPRQEDARAIARAVIRRAKANDVEDIDTSLIGLLTGDGREFLLDTLIQNGTGRRAAENLIDRLTGRLEGRGREGFAKHRNDLDLEETIRTSDGRDLKIVDLMDQDMFRVWQRYSRRMAGSASLARIGITNKAQREEIINAARTEQRALGEEPMDAEKLRAMFSHFNGGPVHGHFRGQQTNEGIGDFLATAKRATNLALLGKLGFAQLAETGASIAQMGLATWLRRGPMAMFNPAVLAQNKALLDDMAYVMGDLGHDHKHFAEWLDLDDVSSADRNTWLAQASKWTAKGQFIQGWTSGFNTVRGIQQQMAAMGMVDKVARTVREASLAGTDIPEALARRFQADLGLNAEDLREIERLINNGTIEFTQTGDFVFVNRLHMDQWDATFRDVFASAITRNVNQVVQRSMAGEQDTWMHTHWGTMLTHLKTFPLQAVQKQFIRNFRHNDQQAWTTLLMGMGTAALAIKVRDAIDGKERTPEETAKIAFGYSNLTGWIPMAVDPVATLLGLEDYRINQYGPHSEVAIPTLEWANRASRLPGAFGDTVTGDADWYDKQSLKALPFANTLGLARILD